MAPFAHEKNGLASVSFTLSFEHPGKARRRTPDNCRDFETTTIRLQDDTWTSELADRGARRVKLSPMCQQFYQSLLDAFATSETPGRTTRTAWLRECVRTGLIEAPEHGDTGTTRRAKQSAFRKHLSGLKACGMIGIDGETVTDLGRGLP